LKRLKKLDELYEPILYEIAEWYDEMGDTKEAIRWYERYLDAFAYGVYSDKVRKNLDALFVTGNDANVTEALKRYDTIMREYRGGPIAEKALAAKIALLTKTGRYDEALALGKQAKAITDPEAAKVAAAALEEAAKKAFAEAVERKDCEKAVAMVEKYGLHPDDRYDLFLYRCYDTYAHYEKALAVAKKHLRDTDAASRAAWLCRAFHALTALGRYREALEAARDYRALAGKKGRCETFDWDLAEVLDKAGSYAEEMALIREMSERYRDDIRMADLYKKGYDRAKREGDTLQQLWMLRRLIALQNARKSHPYSPWAEFEAIRLFKAQGKFADALKIAEGMERLRLKGERRARWLYELGGLYLKTGDKERARERFEACAKMKEGGAWSGLCKEALSLEQL
jgi:tetratricopeptide (TPR) repeat protein